MLGGHPHGGQALQVPPGGQVGKVAVTAVHGGHQGHQAEHSAAAAAAARAAFVNVPAALLAVALAVAAAAATVPVLVLGAADVRHVAETDHDHGLFEGVDCLRSVAGSMPSLAVTVPAQRRTQLVDVLVHAVDQQPAHVDTTHRSAHQPAVALMLVLPPVRGRTVPTTRVAGQQQPAAAGHQNGPADGVVQRLGHVLARC